MLLLLLLVGAAANDRRLTAVPIRLLLFVIRQESVQNNKRLLTDTIFPSPSFFVRKVKIIYEKRNILC
jgi:hypothetical protein